MSKAEKPSENDFAPQLSLDGMQLVHALANRFSNRGVDREELLQSGFEGLLRAEKSYRKGSEAAFTTYAFKFIEGAMRECVRKNSLITLPRSRYYQMLALKNALNCAMIEAESEQKTAAENEPKTAAENARKTEAENEPKAENENARKTEAENEPKNRIAAKCVSEKENGGISRLEEALFELERFFFVGSLDDNDEKENGTRSTGKADRAGGASSGFEDESIERLYISQLLSGLEKQERDVVSLRIFHEKTQRETAVILKISQPKVSRIETAALLRLRKMLENQSV